MAMSPLGWELPLDANWINGSYAQKAYFAKSRERPKITARVGPARCDAASTKQTLIRRRSIIEVLRSAQRTKLPFAAAAPMAALL
ncbi:MAG: hypothetical protein V7775_12080 [Sulfitobacter sp.]